MIRRVLAGAGAIVLFAFACDPIVGTPPVPVPVNECIAHPCSSYAQVGKKPECTADRCVVVDPEAYDYVLVIDVPTTSFYAAGKTFVLKSTDLRIGKGIPKCLPATCIQLPQLASVTTSLSVTQQAGAQMGLSVGTAPLPQATTFIPLSPDASGRLASDVGLPAMNVAAAIDSNDAVLPPALLAYVAPGSYLRTSVAVQAEVPPVVTPLTLVPGVVSDTISISAQNETDGGVGPYALDDPKNGSTRNSHLSRQGGLDGFQAWLEDTTTGIRVSSARTLVGDDTIVRLDTINENDPSGALSSNVNLVIAPPVGAVGIPRFDNGTLGGETLSESPLPALPPPATVTGLVVDETGAGVRAQVVLDSIKLARVAPDDTPGQALSFLKYRATVTSDTSGNFTTVVPLGEYEVTVIPDATTGRARQTLDTGFLQVGSSSSFTCVETATGEKCTLQPFTVSPKSVVTGRAILTDGRPLAGATAIASPSPVQASAPADTVRRTSPWLFPREARTTTDVNGNFTLVAEAGTYDIVVVPQPGSGFGRAVRAAVQVAPPATTMGGGAGIDAGSDAGVAGNSLGQPIVVSAPLKIAFSVVDPNTSSPNPIVQATVRAFALHCKDNTTTCDDGYYVEIGESMTDESGQFEILASPTPPQ